MPTPPYSHPLLAVGTEIWSYPTWQERTKFIVPPFSPEATPALTKISEGEIHAVKAFAQRIHGLATYTERLAELSKGLDNDKDGRRIWATWSKKHLPGWGIAKDIEGVLLAESRHPRQLIGRMGFGMKVPTIEDAGVPEVFGVIAEKLFGEDAFRDPHVARPILKEEINKMISSFLAKLWHNMRNTVSTQYDRLNQGTKSAQDAYMKLDSIRAGERVDPDDFKEWFKAVDTLKELAERFYDDDAIEQLDAHMQRLNWVYKGLTGDISPQVVKGLNKNLRDALKYMADNEDVRAITAQITECVELHKMFEDAPTLDLDPHDVVEWTDGVAHLREKTVGELYEMLGFPDGKIPFLASTISVDTDFASPAHPDECVDNAAQVTSTQPLSLKWHQLVGVVKMVERALASGPVLLMDNVGLGKTLQVVAYFAVMAYYRDFYSKTERYPGIWGTQEWTNYAGERGALPEYPFLFVVPSTLVDQAASECARFLESGAFDIISYFGGYKSHKDVWAALEKRAHTESHMRIFVASSSAVQADSTFIHLPCPGVRNPRLGRDDSASIFGRRYLALAIDEAHDFRNSNKAYTAMRALRDRTDLVVAMTATPVQTRATDLWYLGSLIGLPGFGDDARTFKEIRQMKSELSQAKRKDKLSGNASECQDTLQRMPNEDGAIAAVDENLDQNYLRENARWMKTVRERYQGAVIRRTGESLDFEGNAISGLEPYEEHICLLRLYKHEYDALDALAGESLNRTNSEAFYVRVRRCLLHPSFAKIKDYPEVTTMEQYNAAPSCKLQSLVEILKHHLAVDGAPGIKPSRHQPPEAFESPSTSPLTPPLPLPPILPPDVPLQSQQHQENATSPPDKIVIYCYFATSFNFVEMVLKHNGIVALTIEGKVNQRQRVERLEAFKSGGRDATRVLLISNVGSVGLNLAFANILVIIDVHWSVMSDQQLIGRVWRQPQSKRVHVYRLVAGNSPDILLNNLSFSKRIMQNTFMNIGDSLRKALEKGDSDDITMEDTSATEETGSSARTKKGTGARQERGSQPRKTATPRARPKKGKPKSAAVEAVTPPSAPAAPAAEGSALASAATDAVAQLATSQTQATPVSGQDAASDAMSRMTLSAPQMLAEQPFASTSGPSQKTPKNRAFDYPKRPRTLEDLPATLQELAVLLPGFDAAALPIDTVEADLEEQIVMLNMATTPDFIKYIMCNLTIVQTHRKSIQELEHPQLWAQLTARETKLDWYLLQYTELGQDQETYRGNTVPDIDQFDDMLVDTEDRADPIPDIDIFDDMLIDTQDRADTRGYVPDESTRSSPLSSVPPSPRLRPKRSITTPSVASSSSTRSKRSRETSPVESVYMKRRREAAHDRRERRKAPASDKQFQFLKPEGGTNPQTKQVRNRREFTGDDTGSIRELCSQGDQTDKDKERADKGKATADIRKGKGGKGAKGKNRAR